MQRRAKRSQRSGFALAIALVALAVVMVLVAGWAQLALVQSREAQATLERLQAVWLADSAIERAMARLQVEPNYRGETWQISAAEFGRAAAESDPPLGTAVIAVEPRAGARQITVRADFPAGDRRTNRVSKQATFELPSTGNQS